MPSPTRTARCPRRVPAFTLIELLVVIAIIVVVISIVLPALAGARDVARKTSTQQLITNITNAATVFSQDEGRAPGYFTPTEMGDRANGNTRGMTAMQNAMLDLAKGVVADESAETILVGPAPTAAGQVPVNLNLIGVDTSESGAYFVPDSKYFQPQTDAGKMGTAADVHRQLPSVIDAWGTPMLLWAKNDAVDGSRFDVPNAAAASGVPFVARDADNVSLGRYQPAAFYVASNQSLLSATSLGTKGRNHADTSGSTFSLIGSGVTDTAREQTLTALLGHPAYPDDLAKSDAQQVAPTNARGSFIVQSAGSDGWYLSAKRAGSFYTGSAGNAQITYASMFFGPGGTDRYENNETRDIMQAFDDLMGTAGN